MEKILLHTERRHITGKRVQQLRRMGYVPGIVYGHHTEPIALKIEDRALRQVLRDAGATRLITLRVKGIKEPKSVLVRELQRDVISHEALHVDFYEVIMTERLEAEVPVVLFGEPLPVTKAEGILMQGMTTIRVECLPGDLPPEIRVDLDQLLEIGDAILIRDLELGEAITIMEGPEELVARVVPLEAELVEEVVVEEVLEEIEGEIEGEEAPDAEADGEDQPDASPQPTPSGGRRTDYN